MLAAGFKTILIFAYTFYYYILSFKKNSDLFLLKKRWATKILTELNFDVKIINSASTENKTIFVGNHISFLDIIVLIYANPRIVFISKAEVEKWPILGPAAKKAGTIFVKRNSVKSRANTKRKIVEIVDTFASVHIAGFPSGTTQLHETLMWRKGLFEIAEASDVPIQSFRIFYSPLRECAYIDQDNLLKSIYILFKTQHKQVVLEWGHQNKINNVLEQTEQIRQWTQQTRGLENEKTTFFRPAHTFELQ